MAKKKPRIEDRVNTRVRELGGELIESLTQQAPSIFQGGWWQDRLLSWALGNEGIRIQMLKFVDVLPMLGEHTSLTRHLDEFYQDVRQYFPKTVRLGLDMSANNNVLSLALAYNARSSTARIAERFVAGSSVAEILASIRNARSRTCAFGIQPLSGQILTAADAINYQQRCLNLLTALASAVDQDGLVSQLDQGPDSGHLPRLHVSIDVTALDHRCRSVDHDQSVNRICEAMRPLLELAVENHVHIHLAETDSRHHLIVRDVAQRLFDDPAFKTTADFSFTLCADNIDCETDFKELLKWAKKRKTPVELQLTKGQFKGRNANLAAANRSDLPELDESTVDAHFESLVRTAMKNAAHLRPAIYCDHPRAIGCALAWAEEYGVPVHGFEIQLPFGLGEPTAQWLVARGVRVRMMGPTGALLPAAALLARHALENPSFVRQFERRFLSLPDMDKLLMSPAKTTSEPTESSFTNEALLDFTKSDVRSAMLQALSDVREEFGHTYPLVLAGKSSESRSTVSSRNPSEISEVVGHVAAATSDQTSDAVDGAARTFPMWSAMETSNRCEYLELIAAEMRDKRIELVAWVVLESGRTWLSADEEVAAAIDCCMYYADQMRSLDVPQTSAVAGEDNQYRYLPRGVAAVITPASSPLRSMVNAAMAAIVTGNTVVLKPAQQASVVASKFMEIVRNADVPDGVINFLPGIGSDIGPELVQNPDVDIVCFVGSTQVGLDVIRQASDTSEQQNSVRHLIAELTANNAIIVDEDADIDEAVAAVLQSAFEDAGQNSFAATRIIVLEKIYEPFVERLQEAAKELVVGSAEDPATMVGPVLKADVGKRLAKLNKLVDDESGEKIIAGSVDRSKAKQGVYVDPFIITGVPADSNLVQEESFGPVVLVIPVRNLDDAINVANATTSTMAVGVYSRSPKNLARLRTDLVAGNLFFNSPLGPGVIGRQPSGGFRLSGLGAKSGGPDFLREFLVAVNVTENTARRGFSIGEPATSAE